MVTAIILAGGSGSRFGGETPKQFVEINGRRILDISVQTFVKHKLIDEVILVVHSEWIDKIQKEYQNLIVVSGGKTRRDSSQNGLNACSEDTKFVLIHDSARPFVSNQIIYNCINSLSNCEAVTTAIPVVDTIVEVENQVITRMPNRSKFWAEQTPQGFHIETIKSAHQNCIEDVTDDIKLVHSLNVKSKIVEGNELSFKITNENDLHMAKMIVEKNYEI